MNDIHAHLDFKKFNSDRDKVIKENHEEGIEKIINVGVDARTSKKSLVLAKKYDFVWASVGIHPHAAKKYGDEDVIRIAKMAKKNKVVAVGECGLDFFGEISDDEKKLQRRLLVEQIRIAQENDLPLMLHCRNSYKDMAEVIKHEGWLKGNLHCFAGSREEAKLFLDLGFTISFTGIITYPKNDELYEVVKEIPLDKFMIETDAPYLSPQAVRGERNEPANVKYIYKRVAELKGKAIDKIIAHASHNAKRVFNI
ncbi:MAG: TatD family hydrolase [bacterium]